MDKYEEKCKVPTCQFDSFHLLNRLHSLALEIYKAFFAAIFRVTFVCKNKKLCLCRSLNYISVSVLSKHSNWSYTASIGVRSCFFLSGLPLGSKALGFASTEPKSCSPWPTATTGWRITTRAASSITAARRNAPPSRTTRTPFTAPSLQRPAILTPMKEGATGGNAGWAT